ncbi:MAG: hypothetical protein ACE5HX_01360 [bacterium]
MLKDKQKRVPNVLSPFLERECPEGEEAARFCWRLMNSEEGETVGCGDFWVDCRIATRMFSLGNYPYF